MKKYIIYIILIYILIISILYYNKCYVESNQILTKNAIFDIIESIEDIVISCLTKRGEVCLSEECKLDFAMRYIIDNKKEFNSDIICNIESTYYNKEENIYFGKIEDKKFENIVNKFFYNCDYNIKQYKYYNEGFVDLYFEPVENTSWDNKEYINVEKKDNEYIIDVKYTRFFDKKKNEYYIKYIFDKEIKIKDVTIYNSIMN